MDTVLLVVVITAGLGWVPGSIMTAWRPLVPEVLQQQQQQHVTRRIITRIGAPMITTWRAIPRLRHQRIIPTNWSKMCIKHWILIPSFLFVILTHSFTHSHTHSRMGRQSSSFTFYRSKCNFGVKTEFLKYFEDFRQPPMFLQHLQYTFYEQLFRAFRDS